MQCGIGGNGAIRPRPITEAWRNNQLTLPADFHRHHAFIPSLDYASCPDHKREGLPAVDGTVELGPVFERAGVMHRDLFSRGRTFTAADHSIEVFEAGRSGLQFSLRRKDKRRNDQRNRRHNDKSPNDYGPWQFFRRFRSLCRLLGLKSFPFLGTFFIGQKISPLSSIGFSSSDRWNTGEYTDPPLKRQLRRRVQRGREFLRRSFRSKIWGERSTPSPGPAGG